MKIKTTKRAPIYEAEDGTLYQRKKQTEALRDPEAIREIVGTGDTAEVRWLVPMGYRAGSPAEQAAISAAIEASHKAAAEKFVSTANAKQSDAQQKEPEAPAVAGSTQDAKAKSAKKTG